MNLLRDGLAGRLRAVGDVGQGRARRTRRRGATPTPPGTGSRSRSHGCPPTDELEIEPGHPLPPRHVERDDRGDPHGRLPGRRPPAGGGHVVGLPEPARSRGSGSTSSTAGRRRTSGPAGPGGASWCAPRCSKTMNPELPSYLRLGAHAGKNSLMNTPPMFAIYVTGKVLRWMRDRVGSWGWRSAPLGARARSTTRSTASDGFYRSPVEPAHRSHMNVVFRTPSDELDAAFLAGAEKEGLVNLKGHRSVGGIRASIYNAMTDEGVDALVGFMTSFRDLAGTWPMSTLDPFPARIVRAEWADARRLPDARRPLARGASRDHGRATVFVVARVADAGRRDRTVRKSIPRRSTRRTSAALRTAARRRALRGVPRTGSLRVPVAIRRITSRPGSSARCRLRRSSTAASSGTKGCSPSASTRSGCTSRAWAPDPRWWR